MAIKHTDAICPICESVAHAYTQDASSFCVRNLQKRITALEAALRAIAEHPRCKPECNGAYNEGITEGHRCAAEIAKRALGDRPKEEK